MLIKITKTSGKLITKTLQKHFRIANNINNILMKYQVIRSVQMLVCLSALTVFLFSCRKQDKSETRINDFKLLAGEFKTPPAEYTTAPFFVWNYEITRQEIDHYLKDFRDQGSRQVFIHPRPGLVTEYLSDEWFELFKYTIDRGKEMGMKIWIYDENSYPSGFAGGHVPDQMPESYSQGQGLAMIRTNMLPDTADKYFICLREEDGNYTDITSQTADWKGQTGNYCLFAKTFHQKSDWYGGFSYVDLLLPGVTQKFLDITMKGYEKYAGEEFGKTVPGIFTDEPEIVTSGGIKWTPDLFDVFMEEWGYDLKPFLPLLFEETGEYKRIRHNYTQTLLNLFIERWSKPYFTYCEEKGLKFTGHYWEHGWPSMSHGGDNMAMYAWHHVPGIDMLFNQWNDSTPRAQFGNVRSVKELASAANQTGRQRKLSETYGGAGWELTFTDMKRLGDWEYALGVNFMNQHLSHITLAGARKYDYPQTFTYHEPWWNNYSHLNDHYARLSLVLSSGQQINDILVIEPTTTAWLYDSYTAPNPYHAKIGQSFQTFITTLEKNQVEYDLGSENIMKDLGDTGNGTLRVGHCTYSMVVIPPLTENINLTTFELLKDFVSMGGQLVAFSIPALVDGYPGEQIKEFFDLNKDKIIIESQLTNDVIRRHFTKSAIRFEDITGGDLYHQRRILNDGQIIFLANSSLEKPVKGSITAKGSGAVEMETLTGAIKTYPSELYGKETTISFDLPPAGSLLLYIPEGKMPEYPVNEKYGTFIQVPSSAPLAVARDRENAMPVEFCDLHLNGQLYKNIHTYDAADKVFKFHGFHNGNPWSTSVQFKKLTVDRDTFRTNSGFKAIYHFNVKKVFDFTSLRAVVERPELWMVKVNGRELAAEKDEWWLDRAFGVFNIGADVKQGDNTISIETTPMKIHAEIEPVYITGDFSVIPQSGGWTIDAPAGSLTTGSWKDQGLPFYSWGITYSKEFDIEKPGSKYLLTLDKWNGTVAEVYVNQQPAPIIAFPPYQSDVTGLLRQGSNRVEVKITGSLKNLLGPHFNNPAPGYAGPWLFRNVKSPQTSSDYQLLDYGLYGELNLLEAK
jgi:hypothetical protein